MKRKLILSVFMIMICAGLVFLVKGFQEKAAVIPQPQSQTSAVQEAGEAADTAAASAEETGGSEASAGENSGTSEVSTGSAETSCGRPPC